MRYGDWSGAELKKLAKDPLWKVVQSHPSAMTFPGEGGEAMRDMQTRAVAAVREWNARLDDDAVYAVVSHGDVIKAVLADALGMHLDQFQRIVVDPASVSVVTYTPLRPFVVRVNDVGSDLGFLAPAKRRSRSRRPFDAAVGGGSGASAGAPHRLAAWPARSSTTTRRTGSSPGTVGEPGAADLLPAGHRQRPGDQRRAGEAAGDRPRGAASRPCSTRCCAGPGRPVPALTPADVEDNAPLEVPIEEEFRVGDDVTGVGRRRGARRDRGAGDRPRTRTRRPR